MEGFEPARAAGAVAGCPWHAARPQVRASEASEVS
jgi:hypothetical protein